MRRCLRSFLRRLLFKQTGVCCVCVRVCVCVHAWPFDLIPGAPCRFEDKCVCVLDIRGVAVLFVLEVTGVDTCMRFTTNLGRKECPYD